MAYLPAQYAVEKCGSIGIAVPNGELSLQDDEGREITLPHEEGELCYKGANVTLGYAYTQEDLNNGDERQGFLHTGDVAYRDEDGFYYIVGRKARFLKLFGMRVGLDECEQIIRAKWDIPCACVGTDEKMCVFTTIGAREEEIKKELVDKTHIVASAFEVRVLSELPKTDAGKIHYSKLQTLI
jgi:acyl-coenzyme A synthetase/AMP-(fatty) acid ligase